MPCSCASVHISAGETEAPRCVCSSASPSRASSSTIAAASDLGSTCNRRLQPRAGEAVGDLQQALDRLRAEDEADVPLRDLVAPAAHPGRRDLRLLEEEPGGLLR